MNLEMSKLSFKRSLVKISIAITILIAVFFTYVMLPKDDRMDLSTMRKTPHHFGLRVAGDTPQFYRECPEKSLFLDIHLNGEFLELLNPPGNNQYLSVFKADSSGNFHKLRKYVQYKAKLFDGTYAIESRDVDTDTLKFRQKIRVTPTAMAEL